MFHKVVMSFAVSWKGRNTAKQDDACGSLRKIKADVAQSTGWSAESDPRKMFYALRQDSLLICDDS